MDIEKITAANSRFAKAGVSCFYDSEVLNSSFVHLMKFSAENPRLRQAAKRYMLCLDKNNAEKPTQKFILFFALPFLPTLISTFCIFPSRKANAKNAKRANFSKAITELKIFILNKMDYLLNKKHVSCSILALSRKHYFIIHLIFIHL